MRSKFAIVTTALSMMIALVSCSKDPLANLTEEESRIYITNYDSTAQFSAYKTFSISDTVAVINNGQGSKQSNATDLAFVNAVKQNLQARGFTQVSRTSNPDLAVNVSRIYNTSAGVVRYNDYYDYYGNFYDPFYYGYGGFGYYSPYSYASYSVTEGALTIDLLDLKNARSSNRINVIFTGLIRGSGIFNSSTAGEQVKTIFDQSPYLKTL
ncbi:DUF4136 domain-containing protein [Segetibacter sp. 3557_3]|uniref:DUF4136 domain-containing protein n=1 Tax=Segetibacter sp. 3557_3 TaxID=2547429 RepID=UPI001058573D|nr:DUF4136 domain-containing protein [Segetibacter sp. 3557_3]TDH22997.1 DUF4136 domain-containing protein [Segetibacter sp. 3557_3]